MNEFWEIRPKVSASTPTPTPSHSEPGTRLARGPRLATPYHLPASERWEDTLGARHRAPQAGLTSHLGLSRISVYISRPWFSHLETGPKNRLCLTVNVSSCYWCGRKGKCNALLHIPAN